MKMKEFFAGLVEYKTKCGSDKKTVHDYEAKLRDTLMPAIGEIELCDLRQTDVAKIYEEGRNHGKSGALRGGMVFRQLLRFLKESGHKLDFDWRDILLPKEPRKNVEWLDPAEWEQVRNAFSLNSIIGLRDKALVEILRASGMRISEALSLNRSDIDWERRHAEITNCKTKEREKVFFTEESLSWLKRYLEMRNDKFPPLFVSLNGVRVDPSAVRRTINTSMCVAGISKRVHPHIFRSTYGTTLLFGNVDIKSVQVLMRHKSERTTLRHYIAVSKERCRSEYDRVMNTQVFQNPVFATQGLERIKEALSQEPPKEMALVSVG